MRWLRIREIDNGHLRCREEKTEDATLETHSKSRSTEMFWQTKASSRLISKAPTASLAIYRGTSRMLTAAKEKPLMYTLLPISLISYLPFEVKANITIAQTGVECLEKFVQLFDEIRSAQQTLSDYYSYIKNHRFYVPTEHTRAVADRIKGGRMA
ncbi:MAG: hypothetical protein M1840_005545 [Geoglossum simile]|nr:MAG: hypothetical protein M1840_005545 [Geoglossum simile]